MNQQEKCHLLLYIILGIISIGLFIFSIEFGVTFENRVYKFIVCLIYACVGVTILFHVRMWLSKDDTEFIKDGRYFILNARAVVALRKMVASIPKEEQPPLPMHLLQDLDLEYITTRLSPAV